MPATSAPNRRSAWCWTRRASSPAWRMCISFLPETAPKNSVMQSGAGLPNVHFLPLQPEERLCELLNLANLHVLPQSRGAADLVLPSKLGGMRASGKPVLATADAGTELFEVLSGTA